MVLAGLALCALLGAVWPSADRPKEASLTSWRRTAHGWKQLDTRMLAGEPTVKRVSHSNRVHPLSLAMFQCVSSIVGLVGASWLADEKKTEGCKDRHETST